MLCISTDYPLEFLKLLFQISPFLQHIKLIQTIYIRKCQLYDYINFVIYLCENNLKCLRCLHIQLRSVSDQVRKVIKLNFQNFVYLDLS